MHTECMISSGNKRGKFSGSLKKVKNCQRETDEEHANSVAVKRHNVKQ